MGGGGQQHSSGGSLQGPSTLNPAFGVLAQAFGLPLNVGSGGGLTIAAGSPFGGTGGQFAEGTFANPLVDANTFNSLSQVFQPTGTFDLGQNVDFLNLFGGAGLNTAAQSSDLLTGSVLPGAAELADTGFRTDIQPAIDLSRFTFENEFLPEAAERFGAEFGLGAGDSDFNAAVVREAGRRGNELGALQVQLDEAAALRRLQGLPLAAELAGGATGTQAANLGGLLDIDTAIDEAVRFGGEGGGLFNLLSLLSGQNFTEGSTGESTQSSSGFNFSVL